MAQAAFGNMFEIESSKFALERSEAAPVKAFAQRMVDDHSAAAVKFKEAVLEAKLAMPPAKLNAKHQAVLGELAGKQGDDFDRAYIETQHKATSRQSSCSRGMPMAARIRACAPSQPSCCPRCRRISTTSLRCAEGRSGPPSLVTCAARSPEPAVAVVAAVVDEHRA